MRKPLSVLATIIAVLLLIYGLLRLFGSVPMVGIVAGWWSIGGDFGAELNEALDKVRAFLAANEGIVPLSLTAYFVTSMMMGVALVIGALSWLFKRRVAGLVGVGAYVLLWAAMFVNYGVGEATSKLMLLLGVAAAWVVLYAAWRSESAAPSAAKRARSDR